MAIEWFPHDYHARQDARVMHLLCTCNADGYAAFWVCIESLHVNITLPREMLIFVVAKELLMPRETATKCITTMIDVGLLVERDGVVFSQRVMDNLSARKDLVESKQKAARKRWDTINARAMHVHGKPDANAMLLHNNTVHNNTDDHKNDQDARAITRDVDRLTPTLIRVKAEFVVNGSTEDEAERFYNHYEAQDWKSGNGQRILKWQAKAKVWITEQKTRESKDGKPKKRGDRNTDGSIGIVEYSEQIDDVIESVRAARRSQRGLVSRVPEEAHDLAKGDIGQGNHGGLALGTPCESVQPRSDDGL